MELHQLRYFLMVAETLHFSRAAELLHITQQPLSYQIKQLEDELGVQLFERTTRSVTLTPAGVAFRAEVQAGLTRIERGVELARRFARGENGMLTIGYSNTTLYSVLPPIVRQFRARFPQVEVVLLEMDLTTLERKIFEEEIDVAILSSVYPETPGLAQQTIYQEPIIVALPQNHPLTQQDQVNFSELAEEPFVMYSRNVHRELFDEFIALCLLAGFSPTITQEAMNDSAVVGLVAAGLGVALVASSLRGLRIEGVAYRPLMKIPLSVEVSLVWKEGRQLPWLADIRQIAQDVRQRIENIK